MAKRGKGGSHSQNEPSRLLKAAGHPARLAILSALQSGAQCVNDIQNSVGLSQPNLSQHLALLKRVGWIDSHATGPMRCYYVLRPVLAKGLLGLMARASETTPRSRDSVVSEAMKGHVAPEKAPARVSKKTKPAGRVKK